MVVVDSIVSISARTRGQFCLSAAAEGPEAVTELLAFADALSARTVAAGSGTGTLGVVGPTFGSR